VDTATGQSVEVERQGGDEGLALAGLHLGDPAFVQHHAADQLDVEVAHAGGPPAGLAHQRKGFRQDILEYVFFVSADLALHVAHRDGQLSSGSVVLFAFPAAPQLGQLGVARLRNFPQSELKGSRALRELLLTQRRHLFLKIVDRRYGALEPLNHLAAEIAKRFVNQISKHF